ncbi:MAG: ABC transporter ATP-binding protein [Clostridiales bacterium]|jgi:peptide/nickel transport system ATP-binding protein|nr:ABC transporter ATP-binding protein [Clostridiales bacterium]
MPHNKSDAFLSVQGLAVEYSSSGEVIHAVNGVSFDLKKGGTLGLVGETGAGKTTIAKAIIGILPRPPANVSAGEIFMNGRDLLKVDNAQMRKVRGKEISMIFQDPMTALNPIMRVGEQIAEAIFRHEQVTKKQAEDKGKEMLEMVGISTERYREFPHQFSGGMKQRVVIAMALACNPSLILADEPTTALDVTIQAQVLDMIRSLKNKYGTSMLMITHDLGVVAEICDDVAVVYAGEIVESGSKEQIFTSPKHPYTVGLFKSLPDINSDMERLNPIDGLPPDPSNLPAGCSFGPRCPNFSPKCQDHIKLKDAGNGHFYRCW